MWSLVVIPVRCQLGFIHWRSRGLLTRFSKSQLSFSSISESAMTIYKLAMPVHAAEQYGKAVSTLARWGCVSSFLYLSNVLAMSWQCEYACTIYPTPWSCAFVSYGQTPREPALHQSLISRVDWSHPLLLTLCMLHYPSRFLRRVGSFYKNNPYHNVEHAADIIQVVVVNPALTKS